MSIVNQLKTILLFIAFVLLTTNAISQKPEFKKPDYKGIEKIIKDKSSDYFYPKLFSRFLASDTTLMNTTYFPYLDSSSVAVSH